MKKEKGLKKFNISNKLAYTLIVILSIALLGVGVIAVVPNPGHSLSEIELPACTSVGQSLTWNGNAWVCTNPIDARIPSCSNGQVMQRTSSGWDCISIYQCPTNPIALDTLHCDSVQLLRNGVSYCHGQLSIGGGCYFLDSNCQFSGTWGICTPIGTSPPRCGDSTCESSKGENCYNCESDCGACPTFCNYDTICDSDESCIDCPDCGVC